MLPVIFALSGPRLTADEQAFFSDAAPAGFILFGRNCVDKAQLSALTAELRDLAGRADLPVLIDQEGGRVARLGPPEWPAFPSPEVFDRLYRVAPMSAIEAARVNALAIAMMLREVGVTANCAPVLDLRHDGAHPVVGNRTFGADAMQVAALGRAALEGFAAGGVCGILKHMPGHGRARADSHHELPLVAASREELESDFAPFRSLAGAPMAMTAHILYSALDADRPASLSPTVIGDTIRRDIGFDGLLMSDDIGMKALAGPAWQDARAAIDAGCDLALHCSGDLAEMEKVAAALPPITDAARARLGRAMRLDAAIDGSGPEALAAQRDALLAYA